MWSGYVCGGEPGVAQPLQTQLRSCRQVELRGRVASFKWLSHSRQDQDKMDQFASQSKTQSRLMSWYRSVSLLKAAFRKGPSGKNKQKIVHPMIWSLLCFHFIYLGEKTFTFLHYTNYFLKFPSQEKIRITPGVTITTEKLETLIGLSFKFFCILYLIVTRIKVENHLVWSGSPVEAGSICFKVNFFQRTFSYLSAATRLF